MRLSTYIKSLEALIPDAEPGSQDHLTTRLNEVRLVTAGVHRSTVINPVFEKELRHAIAAAMIYQQQHYVDDKPTSNPEAVERLESILGMKAHTERAERPRVNKPPNPRRAHNAECRELIDLLTQPVITLQSLSRRMGKTRSQVAAYAADRTHSINPSTQDALASEARRLATNILRKKPIDEERVMFDTALARYLRHLADRITR